MWYLLVPPTDVVALGAFGERFPGNLRAASGEKHTHRVAHDEVLTRCVSLLNTSALCLHCPLSVQLVYVSGNCHHKVVAYGTRYMKFPNTGHYHVMKECYHYLDLFSLPKIKAKGESDKCIP